LIAAGAAGIALAVLGGGATFALVVIVPVFFGSSPLFAFGVLLLIVGVFLLPLTFSSAERTRPVRHGPSPTPAGNALTDGATGGGVILVGPVPLLFGSWRAAPRWAYWGAALVGGVLLAAFLLWVVVG
jgi:uncharacterized membrane protein